MPSNIVPLNAGQLGNLIATDIQKSATGTTPTASRMAAAVAEVTVESQTLGASLLVVTVIDPGWVIARAGFLDVNDDGLLDEIDINFPQGSGMWWRLAMIDLTNDMSQANVTLTFQDRIVSYMQDCWGPVINRQGQSRARFIKFLVDKMPAEIRQLDGGAIGKGPLSPPTFICKELNVVQPLAGDTTSGTTTVTTPAAIQRASKERGNKAQVGASSTGGGAWKVTASAESLGGQGACRAIQAEGYSELSTNPNLPVSQLDFAGLGKIPCLTPMIITNPANGKSVTAVKQDVGAGSSFLPVMGLYPATVQQLGLSGGQFTVVVERADGVPLKPVRGTATQGTSPTGSGTSGATVTSDLKTLTRGTTDNPDEDTWTCAQRLANEVNWPLFTAGGTVYYDPGTELIKQKPAVYLSLDDTGTTWTATHPGNGDTAHDVVLSLDAVFDNTAFTYQATKKKKGKVQRATRLRTPQTPSQIRMNMICGVFDYQAGDVFVFRKSGPINGPWLCVDATRNCLADRHTQFTLAPGTAPNPEPTVTTSSSNSNFTTAETGSVTAGSIGGYINPFVKMMNVLLPERIDMGVDFGCSASGEIVAIGPGTITNLTNSGWNYGGNDAFIEWKLTSGSFAGKYVYFAEAIRPTVHIGQAVNTGDVIGTMIPGGSGIECGWSVGTGGTTLAASTGDIPGGDPGGRASAAGRNFNQFLVALGSKSGTPNSGGNSSASMPAGWPSFSTKNAAALGPSGTKAAQQGLTAAGNTVGAINIPSLFGT